MIVHADGDAPTAIVPQVRPLAHGRPAAPRGALRSLLPWAGFGLVAVAVVAGAVTWASTLRGAPAPAAVLGESSAAVAPPTATTVPAVAVPVAAAPAALAPPAPTARRAVPPVHRTPVRPIPLPVLPPSAVAPAPTAAAPTTTPASPWPVWSWPGYTPSCADAATATDPSCKTTSAEDAPDAPDAP